MNFIYRVMYKVTCGGDNYYNVGVLYQAMS